MKKNWILFTIVLISIYCFIAIFISPSFGDELNYHYPLARNINLKQILDPQSDYSSAYMPLPYLIGRALLLVFDSLIALRILNFVVFELMILFYYFLARKFSEDHILLTLLVFFNPYLQFSSFIFYMYNWGLFFAFIGFYFYFIKKSYILADLFLSMAVLSQQWMLVMFVAIIFHEGVIFHKRKHAFADLLKSLLRKGIFLAPAGAIFLSWKGLIHPNFSSHALQPNFANLSALLAIVGFAMIFPVLYVLRSFLHEKYIPILFLLPLFWLSIPIHSSYNSLNQITGYFPHLAMKIERFLHMPYALTMFLFVIPGLLSLMAILKKIEEEEIRIFTYVVLGFITVFVASARLASAHIYLMFPFLLLLFHKEIERMKWLKKLMVAQYLLVSLSMVTYYVFFRSRGIVFLEVVNIQ